LFFKEEKDDKKDNLYELNMPLLTYVFEESVKRFYSHKVIKKIAKSALGVDGQQAENNEMRELDEQTQLPFIDLFGEDAFRDIDELQDAEEDFDDN
jgi:phosphoribosylanthranilate isomerase